MMTPFFVGAVRVTPMLNQIAGAHATVQVEPRVMAVLVALAARPGEVIPRGALLEAGWPGTASSDEGLTKAVSLLRQALGDTPASASVIQTIPKRGYRLVAPVRPADPADAPDAAPPVYVPRTADARNPQAPRGFERGRLRRMGAAAGFALVFLAGLATGLDRARDADPPGERRLYLLDPVAGDTLGPTGRTAATRPVVEYRIRRVPINEGTRRTPGAHLLAEPGALTPRGALPDSGARRLRVLKPAR
jgi:DNA-binding winged helix-turn-helix (wHTH) protein